MSRTDGWRPFEGPGAGGDGVETSAFGRLARTHAFSIAGDTMITLALADSIFFGISPSDARPKVLLYLVLTMAPFALVAPLLGPWIDSTQGGRRVMIVGAALLRAVVCVLLVDDIDGLLLFPEAFAALVLAKSHHVARSALVPSVVADDSELVEANSKLAVISGVVGFAAGIPGVILLQLGAEWVLAAGAVIFLAGALAGLRMPSSKVAESPADDVERAELRGAGVLLAASAMAFLRGIVGFMTFHIAFLLRTSDAPAWWFGVVIAASAAGGLAGAATAAPLRRNMHEEPLLTAALGTVAAVGALAAIYGGRGGATLLACVVGFCAAGGKTAFDSIVQRDAPDANQGRSFARFETRFQLVWVIGALGPVVAPIPDRVGFLIVAAAAAFAAVSYAGGRKATHS